MTAAQTKINLLELPLEHSQAGSRFEVSTTIFGVQLGLFGLGATLHEVPPGKTASPFHRHHTSDEMFLVLSGTGIYRYGDARLPIKEWDCLGAPAPGEGHQIINTGDVPLRYLGFSNNTNADVVEYPDSGRIRIDIGATGHHRENATFGAGGRLVPMGFWEGEQLD
ncbi:MAG: cupin domain-containing protein [Proteobacteria bacterium]|nr:cupin domain-containing protein [Pseudomonadota bacterium]MBI3499211.1 cupin domain-containing protein [Pseudomonadota bacterium]